MLSLMPSPALPVSNRRRINHVSRNTGFTLVETLVVLVIIAILAAILLPIIGRARENGRRAVCQSRLQQLGMAFQQYVLDNSRYPGPGNYQAWGNGGHWVAGTNDPNCANTGPTKPPGCLAFLQAPYDATGNTANLEGGALSEYVKVPNAYSCPSNETGEDKRLSYSMNCALAGLRQNMIRNPQEIILLVDEDKANDGYLFAVDPAPGAANLPGFTSTDELTKIHNGGGNLLFADGHVKWVNPTTFPLDYASTEGQENKWYWPEDPMFPTRKPYTSKTVTRPPGWPRFHDAAFGPKGSSTTEAFLQPPLNSDSTKQDACFVPLP